VGGEEVSHHHQHSAGAAVCRMMTFPRELGTNLGICPPFCGHIYFFSEPSAKSMRARAHGVVNASCARLIRSRTTLLLLLPSSNEGKSFANQMEA
jgi:hypothetical protein